MGSPVPAGSAPRTRLTGSPAPAPGQARAAAEPPPSSARRGGGSVAAPPRWPRGPPSRGAAAGCRGRTHNPGLMRPLGLWGASRGAGCAPLLHTPSSTPRCDPIRGGPPGAAPSPHTPLPRWRLRGGDGDGGGLRASSRPAGAAAQPGVNQIPPTPAGAGMPGGARHTGGSDAGIPTGPPGTSGCPPAAARPVQPVRMTRALLHPLPPGLLPTPAPPGTPGTRAQGPALPLPGGAIIRTALSSCGQHRGPAGCSVPAPGGSVGSRAGGREHPASPQGALAAGGTEPMTGAVVPGAGEGRYLVPASRAGE